MRDVAADIHPRGSSASSGDEKGMRMRLIAAPVAPSTTQIGK